MRWLEIAVSATCACGPTAQNVATVAPPPTESNVANETLRASLEREVGAGHSVAIVGTASGIVAVSSDGARQRLLVKDRARWVLVDARSEVVWFGNAEGTEYRAIDLEAPAQAGARDRAHAITVVTGLPKPGPMEMVGPVHFGVSYPNPSDPEGARMFADFTLGDCCANASMTLEITAEPEMLAGVGYQQDPDWSAAAHRAEFPGRAFLASLLARPDHRGPSRAPPPETKIAGVDPKGCEDPAQCGRAQPIAGTHYLRVLVTSVTGDVGHLQWRIYDGDKARFVDQDWGTWLQNAWVAPDGTAFVANGVVVRFETGPVSAAQGNVLGGGWLGDSTFFGS